MRWTETFIHTLRQEPSDAEVVSHRLMARAALITKVAAGIYNYLPLGWRSLRKLEAIIRQEMERAGSSELSWSTSRRNRSSGESTPSLSTT